MNAYIVSWGIENGEDYIETESIVHASLEDAREEFAALEPAEAVKGAVADEGLKRGWKPAGRLLSVEMLDEQNNPTDDIAAWVYEGASELLEHK